jgi:hypothetical protein
MKFKNASLPLIVGACLIMVPFVFEYAIVRLMSETLATRADLTKMHLDYNLPWYYVPACLFVGVACIGFGLVVIWRRERVTQDDDEPETYTVLNLQ